MDPYRRFRIALAALVAAVGIGTVGSVIILDCSWLDALFMTIITLSTMGYGDVAPGHEKSQAAHVFTMILIMAGIGLLLYVVSTITAFLVEGELTDLLRRRKMDNAIERLSSHYIVCGAGLNGTHVIEELAAAEHDFVVIEQSQEAVDRALATVKFLYILDDATHDQTLLHAGVEKARGLITTLADDKDNLFVSFTARQLNPKIRIITRSVERHLGERLLKAGADAVVFPDHIGVLRIVSEMLRPTVVGFLDRMLRTSEETWRFEEVPVRADSRAIGKTLQDLRIRERVGLPILATWESEDCVSYHPDPGTVLREGMHLVVLTERSHLDRLRDILD